MRRKMDRTIYLLVFGFSPEEWERSQDGEKCRRRCKDLGLSVELITFPSLVETIKYVREHKILDLVYFSENKSKMRGEHGLSDAMAIAQVLSEHSHSPWIVLAPSFEDLEPVFSVRGVRVGKGQISDVLWERWMSHVKGQH